MKRSPIARRTPLRRTGIIRTATLAATGRTLARKRKTSAGEFSRRDRQIIFRRFDGRCARCGDPMHPKSFTVQHIRARGMGGSKDPATASLANGVAVHEIPCHRHIEANPLESLLLGYRDPQGVVLPTRSLMLWTGQRVHLTPDGAYLEVAAAETEERA